MAQLDPQTNDTASLDPQITRRLAVGLDFDNFEFAMERARVLRPWFGVAKVGHELYAAAGPRAVSPNSGS